MFAFVSLSFFIISIFIFFVFFFLVYFLSSKFCWSAHFVVMLFLCAASRWFSAFCCQIFRLLSHLLRDQRKDEEKEAKQQRRTWRRRRTEEELLIEIIRAKREREKPSSKVSDADMCYKPNYKPSKLQDDTIYILYQYIFYLSEFPHFFSYIPKRWSAINLSSRSKRQRFLIISIIGFFN